MIFSCAVFFFVAKTNLLSSLMLKFCQPRKHFAIWLLVAPSVVRQLTGLQTIKPVIETITFVIIYVCNQRHAMNHLSLSYTHKHTHTLFSFSKNHKKTIHFLETECTFFLQIPSLSASINLSVKLVKVGER